MEKRLSLRIISFLLVVCMMMAFVPYMAPHAHAAAPTSYTTITAGSSATVSISSSGMSRYFKFVPTTSGTYNFYSSGSYDTYGYLLNSSGSTLASNDDGGGNGQFSIEYYLTAGTTYYFQARMYSGSQTGSFTVYLRSVTVDNGNTTNPNKNINNPVQTKQGANVYSLFNSGATSSSGRTYYDVSGRDANPNSSSYNNSGYDIYGYSAYNVDLTLNMGLPFKINGEVTERGSVTIYAYDIDEESDQIDDVYLVDSKGNRTHIGTLYGRDSQWSTTTLYLDPSLFKKGETYYFQVDVCMSGWLSWVRTVSVNLTIGEPIPPSLTTDLTASISNSGMVTTSLSVLGNTAATYYLEYTATINGEQKGGYEGTSISISPNVTATKQVSFQLESGYPSGTYTISVVLKDANGNVKGTDTYNVSVNGYAVNYNSNGGSQNVPFDTRSYTNGSTVTVLFDYIPSRSGYKFLGWARSSTAKTPDFTQNGTKTFKMGASNVTLYAVWGDLHTHDYKENVVPPTCMAEGYTDHVCDCGESYRDSYVAKIDHDLSTVVITPPTCEEGGTGVTRCSMCSYETEVYYPPIGHNYESAVTKEATCTEPGIMTYTCKNCQDSYDVYIYSTHNIEVVERTEATCEVDGKIVYGCTKCPYTYEEIIPGGHDYIAEVITLATPTSESLVRYTCSICGHSYDVTTPPRPEANILLVQDRRPWSEDSNTVILERLLSQGYITGWDLTTTSGLANVDLTQYSVIFIANDQSTATYNELAKFNDAITTFVEAGGVVVYGACDQGWAAGNISYALPGGVTKGNYYSYYNYVVNGTHNVVTGVLTDGKALTNQLLYSTYSSHTYFNNLPENAIVILSDANGGATLVEYPLGNGYVIASGLTWEYTYVRNFVNGTSFAKSVYDDLLVHALSLTGMCEHLFGEGTVTPPSCEADGYTEYTCEKCGAVYRTNEEPKLEHNYNETVITPASCGVAGTGVAVCENCGDEVDVYYPPLDHNYESEVTKEATCTEPGVMTYTCKNCGDEYTVYIYATHEIEEVSRVEATCEEDGKIEYGCTKCDYTYEEIIKGGHDYVAEVITLATATSEGLVRYTCSKCGHSYDVTTPPRPKANILLVQDRLPWTEDINEAILNRLLNDGYITGWDMTTTKSFTTVDLTQYSVIYIANDQTTATYNELAKFNDAITTFVEAGGVVVYGACDHGWAAGNISYALPGGVTKGNYYSNYNYIVNGTHNVVTGVLTDGKALTNKLLYSTYSSHTYFNNLPEDAVTILTDSKGGATLVEYPLGKGYVIASGLTWEYTYVRNFVDGTSFAKSVYDDLLVHAVSISGSCKHVFGEGTVVPPTCEDNGYTAYVCENCGVTYKANETQKLGHDFVQVVVKEPVCGEAGYGYAECTVCGAKDDIYLPAPAHDYVGELTKEATCTEPGVMTYTCKLCANEYVVYIYATHEIEEISRVEATCEEDGKIVYGCTKCDHTYEEVIKGGHVYEAEIITLATPTNGGLIKYTCVKCGDYYHETTPPRPEATILLVQDRLPWTENINETILNRLLSDGYITGWDMTTTKSLATVDLTQYSVIYVANDQTTATYNELAKFNEAITAFVEAGGVVVYGACDHGWAAGNISYALPGGVTKGNYYSYNNHIANNTHNIVTGVLTDGKALTNQLLYSTYSSHTYFNNLPENATIILSDSKGGATLVEYPLGNGYVIASGLTWEYTYVRNFVNGTSFAKSVYDDLLVHAISISSGCDHIYGDEQIVLPTCVEDGYTQYTCTECGATIKADVTQKTGHEAGAWEIVLAPTTEATGLKEQRCTICGDVVGTEVLPILDAGVIRVETVKPYVIIGEEIEFILVVEGCDPIKSMGVTPIFDTSIFDIVSAEWIIDDAVIENIEAGTYKSVIAWENETDVNTSVYKFTLKAKALTERTNVSCELRVSNNDGVVIMSVIPVTVKSITCPHEEMTYEQYDEKHHICSCDYCGYTDIVEHIYEDECDSVCDCCGYERVAPHKYYEDKCFDETNHWAECELCGKQEEIGEHVFDGVCDSTCNDCDYEREAPHQLINKHDDSFHWQECELCQEIKGKAEHLFTAICDPTCGECEYERVTEHDLELQWSRDENCHWYACKRCDTKVNYAEHTFDALCDSGCNDCGYERVAPHLYDTEWRVDENKHWHECGLCGDKKDFEDHVYDNAGDKHCDTCGYWSYLLGDVDNDWDVDSDDAIYLLYHIFYGEADYPVYQPLDFNGDETENSDDAVYLLYFVLFGSVDYPLTRN